MGDRDRGTMSGQNDQVRTFPVAVRVALMGGLVGVLLLIGLVGSKIGPWRDRAPSAPNALPNIDRQDSHLPDPPDLKPPAATDLQPNTGGDLGWLKWVLIGLGIVVVIALFCFLVQSIQQGRQDKNDKKRLVKSADSAPLSEPVRVELSALPFNPRIAADDIISAWQQVEEAAERAGSPRPAQHTATEFLTALAQRVPVHPDAAGTLLAAYQRARFDHAALDPAQVSVALGCAQTVIRDLGATPGPGRDLVPGTPGVQLR